MKRYTIGSTAIVAMAAAAMAWTSVAFAEDHSCCGTAPAATAPVHSAAKSAAPAKVDDAAIAAQKAGYPLDTCVVLGNKLGEHDAAVDHVYNGRLVRFCCAGCIATFEKDPQKYLKKIDDAKAKAGAKTDAAGETQGAHSEHHH